MGRAGDTINQHNDLREEWFEDTLVVRNYRAVEGGFGGKTDRSEPVETETTGRLGPPDEVTRETTARGEETSADAMALIPTDINVHGANADEADGDQDDESYASEVVGPNGREYRVLSSFDLGTGRQRVDLRLINA